MLVMGPDGGALIPRMFCGGKTMQVRCKKTGEDIIVKLDGGQCACMTAEACCLQEAVLDRIARTTNALMDAVKAERERCAKIAKALSKIDPHGPRIALEIAAQIERGE